MRIFLYFFQVIEVNHYCVEVIYIYGVQLTLAWFPPTIILIDQRRNHKQSRTIFRSATQFRHLPFPCRNRRRDKTASRYPQLKSPIKLWFGYSQFDSSFVRMDLSWEPRNPKEEKSVFRDIYFFDRPLESGQTVQSAHYKPASNCSFPIYFHSSSNEIAHRFNRFSSSPRELREQACLDQVFSCLRPKRLDCQLEWTKT